VIAVCYLETALEWWGTGKVMPLDQNATATDLQTVDLLVGGGAQDRQQEIVMRPRREALAPRRSSGTPALYLRSTSAVRSLLRACCWAANLGLGLFDFVSVHPNAHRCIGNLVIQVTAKRLAGTGSDDRLHRTLMGLKITVVPLGQVEPLGRVVRAWQQRRGWNRRHLSECDRYLFPWSCFTQNPFSLIG